MSAQSLTLLLVTVFLVTALLFDGGGDAYAQKKSDGKANIEMNFKNVEIVNFLQIMSTALDMSLVWDETKVRGSITLVSPKKFNRHDAIRIFETVLQMHGFTTVQTPGSPIVQVVPAADASRLPSPTPSAGVPQTESGFFVTQILPLRYADANQVRAALTPLISKSAGLAVYAPGNLLVLSDTETNITRLQSIIEQMDVPPEDIEYAVIKLQFASAAKMGVILTNLAGTLQAEVGAAGGATPQPAPQRRRQPAGAKPGAAASGVSGVKIVADDRTNSLLMVGESVLLAKFKEIITLLDVPGEGPSESGYRVVALQFADARKMGPLLTTLASALPSTSDSTAAAPNPTPTPRPQPAKRGSASDADGDVKIVADERTNKLILVGQPELLDQFERIIATLDVPSEVEETDVQVLLLKHADATEIVKILKDIDIKAPTTTAVGGATPAKPQDGGRAQVQKVTLTADKATNALIMFGPTDVIRVLERMVVALDVPRSQVYVEVLIMEMSLEKSLQLGVNWQATAPVANGVVGAGFPNGSPKTLEGALAGGSGSALGVIGDTITFGGQKFTSFSAFVQASQSDGDLNVLATPQLLTLNNEEAEINVSQVVPVSTRTVTGSNLQTTTEYEFKDVGIILNITPQITGEDRVRLIIKQESSSIATRQDTSSSTQTAITTLKRKISTQVVVDNNTTMAIGGLIQDQKVETESKVPFLGDLPLIGALFRSTGEENRKTNLIVFIRPRIIRTQADMEAATRSVQGRYESARSGGDADKLLRESFELPPGKDGENGDEPKVPTDATKDSAVEEPPVEESPVKEAPADEAPVKDTELLPPPPAALIEQPQAVTDR